MHQINMNVAFTYQDIIIFQVTILDELVRLDSTILLFEKSG